jgi:aquaporin Z
MTSSRFHWWHYLIEAWGLGTFMVVAGSFAIALSRAPEPLASTIAAHPIVGRLIFGVAMGVTAMAIVYSSWGARSGAHLNPSLTLTFAWLGKIEPVDAVGYVIAQFVGGAAGFTVVWLIAGSALTDPPVRGIVTRPGAQGPIVAFAGELTIAFILMTVVLIVSNAEPRIARFTGVAAAICVATFITVEAPISGMSLNPARTTASALIAHDWTDVGIYYTAPLLGMLAAAAIYASRRGGAAVRCARLNHTGTSPCIFRCGYAGSMDDAASARTTI